MLNETEIRSFISRRGLAVGFLLAFTVLAGASWLLLEDGRKVTNTARRVTDTYEVMGKIELVRSRLSDAESAQRGYLLTGDESYLESYRNDLSGINSNIEDILRLTADIPTQQKNAEKLRSLTSERSAMLSEGVLVRRTGGFEAARHFVFSGTGKRQMDQIRDLTDEMTEIEAGLLRRRNEESQSSTVQTMITFIAASSLSLILLTAVFLMLNHQIGVRRQAEEALTAALEKERVLLDSAVDAICTVDNAGRFTSMNPACEKLWGYRPEEMIGRHFKDFIVPDDVEKSEDAAQSIVAGQTETDFENRYLHKNGSYVNMTWSAKWSDTEQLMFCVARDITERKMADEKLRKFAIELERSNTELQDFASVASHDLQEPLRKIQSFADELKTSLGGNLPEDDLDTMDRMIAAAGRMRTLIDDLLSFSRVTTQAKPFVQVDLNAVAQEALSDLEARTRDTNGHVEIGHLPTIDADPMQMRQLFQNLIGNGLKFHRPGVSPLITINGSNGGNTCHLTIADNGIGFDEKYLDRIFTVFQRLHGRNEFEGTGIGLAICRKIVERHGGGITASSAPGAGATFKVTLPAKQSLEERK